jgi:hypothetical protein
MPVCISANTKWIIRGRLKGHCMRHWVNREFGAANVMEVGVDPLIVDEFLPLTRHPGDDSHFCCYRPNWNSDIRWISASAESSFDMFQSAFDRLNVARHVAPFLDLEEHVRLYVGFIVLRSECTSPSFHLDWIDCNNEGFTLITPISDCPPGFGMLYNKLNGQVAPYEYRRGQALIFGDHFWHSTAPGKSDRPVALLSFTFGTDKMIHWKRLSQTAADQSSLIRKPNGEFAR